MNKKEFEQKLLEINEWLSQKPNDVYLLKLKILLYESNLFYAEALNLLEESLDMHPNNNELKEIKERIYNSINSKIILLNIDRKYNESLKLCNDILNIRQNDSIILFYKEKIETEQQDYVSTSQTITSSDRILNLLEYLLGILISLQTFICKIITPLLLFVKKYLIQVFVILMICFFVMIVYFHPTKETMYCNSNYFCTVEHEFLSSIKIKNTLTLHPNSIMSEDVFNASTIGGGRYNKISVRNNYKSNIYFDNYNPFIMYYNNHVSMVYNKFNKNKNFYIVESKFKNYLQNPSDNFEISSDATPIYSYFIIIMSIIIIAIVSLSSYAEIKK